MEAGRDVTDLRVGDRVAVDPNLYCGRCDNCRNEMGNHCANWQGVGVTRSGGFADYCAAPARACYHVPAALSDAQMAFIEPLACVAHAMKRFRVTPGDDLLLFGAGPMGQLLVQVLRHSGAARVVVVDKQPERLALATGGREPAVTRYGITLFAYAQSLDIAKARRLLDWSPRIPFAEGLERSFGPAP